jgi:phosphoribosylglycinamide formyltransferase 1
MTLVKLAVVLSGRGSNFKAILANIQAGQLPGVALACVISNHAQAEGLAIAQAANIPCISLEEHTTRASRDIAMLATLQQHQADWVILAGYDRIIGEPVLTAYAGRILNIHPSLLPKFGGKGMVGQAVHTAVLAAQETRTGCTVHTVTADVDAGQILGQATVPVLPHQDTPEALAARVLAQEHALYSQVIKQVCTPQPIN